jgi:hypothetical protein
MPVTEGKCDFERRCPSGGICVADWQLDHFDGRGRLGAFRLVYENVNEAFSLTEAEAGAVTLSWLTVIGTLLTPVRPSPVSLSESESESDVAPAVAV